MMHSNCTRQPKICVKCNEPYTPTGNCQKYCNDCKSTVDKNRARKLSYDHAVRTGRITSPGVGSGNAQGFGEEHHSYKLGTGMYKKHNSGECSKCGNTLFTCVHHVDGNRQNNAAENLVTLCRSCHRLTHEEMRHA